ncbi:hypothetical protein TNCV_1997711 [Trichonephila clavipes]|uniref:Uncharacterized protein n=1 Tax=Trichonephila clavipes TaxID=2585209 RepID=A0A8X6RQR5_TRICX|nr:hypothetical protein TNCV_1997711 [Trichonephila clavipes]
MKLTWCEIRTVIQALQANSSNTVLRFRRRMWTRIIIQQQNARFEMPRSFFSQSSPSISTGCHSTYRVALMVPTSKKSTQEQTLLPYAKP